MNWTPHRVDSSGRIQDEPATVQQQESTFQMTEADESGEDSSGMVHISQGLEPPILSEPQDVPPPEEPHTLPRPSNHFPRPLTDAELDEFTDSSGRLDFRAIFLAQGFECPIIFQQLEDMYQSPSPETRHIDSSGRIQDQSATEQPQDSIFQMTEAEMDEFREDSFTNDVFLSQPQDVPPPEEPQTLPRPSNHFPRPLTDAELDEFTDSSGRLDFRAIFSAQGFECPILFQQLEDMYESPSPENRHIDSSGRIQDEPATEQPQDSIFQMIEAELDEFREDSFTNDVFLSQPQDVPPREEPQTLPRPSNHFPHPLMDAELDEFTDSWGRLDYRAIFLAQGLEPPIILQQIEDRNWTPPSETPVGLSEETISNYLKTMNADEFRAHNKDGDRKICAVCLDDVCGQKDVVAILDNCGHEFHYCCLKTWLRRKNNCPLCRRTAIFLLGDDR